MVPLAHCATTATTLASTSSLCHFLSILQAMIFVPIFVAASLIRLMMISHVPLSVSYLFLTSSASSFSFVFSSRNCVECIPHDGSHVMCMMRSTSIDTRLSIHMSLPCVMSINCLMQLLAYCPLPKCGTSNRSKMLLFAHLVSHWSG
jgi:hypothetical protein